jgi:hypothetical protein
MRTGTTAVLGALTEQRDKTSQRQTTNAGNTKSHASTDALHAKQHSRHTRQLVGHNTIARPDTLLSAIQHFVHPPRKR